jgi:hypothetical protein
MFEEYAEKRKAFSGWKIVVGGLTVSDIHVRSIQKCVYGIL